MVTPIIIITLDIIYRRRVIELVTQLAAVRL